MSGWLDALAQPGGTLSLRYRTGLRKAERGETLLELSGDGHATVANVRSGESREFSGDVPQADLEDLFSALVAADFPNAPVQTVPPGAGLIALEISVEGDENSELEHAPILLHRTFLRDYPAWGAVVRRLDRICSLVSADAIVPA
jgi:hypothetical protein